MPIPLGILAVAGAGGAAGAYEQIATTLLTTDTASLSFSSLPSGYKHFQIRMTSRSSRSATSDSIGIRFNSDTGTNYSSHWLFGNGSSVFSQNITAYDEILGPAISANSNPASSFAGGIIDILDLQGTKNKTLRHLSGIDGGAGIWLGSGLWINTGTVTSISLRIFGGGFDLKAGSRFSLYGIKG
jgi:hypothetical protein